MANESQQNINTESDEISIKEMILKIRGWFQYLLSKWIIILAFALTGAVFGAIYANNKKPVYTATTTFVLEDEKSSGGLGGLAGLASMAGVNVNGGGGIFQGGNILELYKSRKMLQKTLFSEIVVNGKKMTLVNLYIDFNGIKKKWTENSELKNLKFVNDSVFDGKVFLKTNRLRDSVLTGIIADIAKNYLTVAKPDKDLAIIQVDVKAQDELFAKSFNESIVKNVNDFYLQTKTKKSFQNVQILQQKTDSVRTVMNGAIYTAVAVADATPNLNPTRQVQRVAPAQKAQFSAETNRAILSSLVQNLEMSKLALMKETPLLEVIDQPVFPLRKDTFGMIKGVVIGGVFGALMICAMLGLQRIFKLILA